MKLTQQDIAVVEGDTHLSKWITEGGRLDQIGPCFRAIIPTYVKPGCVVCDVGACLGDHSEFYQRLVGPTGTVHSFEPNPEAFECLKYNMRQHENVIVYNVALGDHNSTCSIVKDSNLGACRIQEGGPIEVTTLDDVSKGWKRLDFIKIDVEGKEPLVLLGAIKTISKFKPVMLIEVNHWTLQPSFSQESLVQQIASLGYYFHVCNPVYCITDPEFDLICIPLK